jgi:hypothetical protein
VLRTLEPAFRDAIAAVINRHIREVDMAALVAAFEASDLRLIEEVVNFPALARALRDELDPAWDAALRRGSDRTIRELGLAPGVGAERISPFVVAWASQNAVNLVTQVTDRTREGLRATVVRGLSEGVRPREMARRLVQVQGFGLTFRQSLAVDNFRIALERALDLGTDPMALTGNFKLARDVLRPRQRFTRESIGRLTEAYRDRWILHRAHTIARSESIRAFSMGRMDGWLKGAREGRVDREQKQMQWLVSPDERACPICIPMHRQLRDLGQPFTAGNGSSVMVPGDTHPTCRCAVILVRARTRKPTEAGVRADQFIEERLAEEGLEAVA